jgi:hypothetical protein
MFTARDHALTHLAKGQEGGVPVSFILTSLLLGVLAALVAGFMHRKDVAPAIPPLPALQYSWPAAITRGGAAFIGATTLSMASMMSTRSDYVLLVLLAAAIAGGAFGLLHHADRATVPAAIWRGASVFAAVAGLGLSVLSLYTAPSEPTTAGIVQLARPTAVSDEPGRSATVDGRPSSVRGVS